MPCRYLSVESVFGISRVLLLLDKPRVGRITWWLARNQVAAEVVCVETIGTRSALHRCQWWLLNETPSGQRRMLQETHRIYGASNRLYLPVCWIMQENCTGCCPGVSTFLMPRAHIWVDNWNDAGHHDANVVADGDKVGIMTNRPHFPAEILVASVARIS